jgi:hypothetical protein
MQRSVYAAMLEGDVLVGMHAVLEMVHIRGFKESSTFQMLGFLIEISAL